MCHIALQADFSSKMKSKIIVDKQMYKIAYNRNIYVSYISI